MMPLFILFLFLCRWWELSLAKRGTAGVQVSCFLMCFTIFSGLSWFCFVHYCHLTCMILEGVGLFVCFSCVLFQVFKGFGYDVWFYDVDRCDWIYKRYISSPLLHSSLNSNKYTSRLTSPANAHSPSTPVSQGPSNPHPPQTQPYHLDPPCSPRDEHRQAYSAQEQAPSY